MLPYLKVGKGGYGAVYLVQQQESKKHYVLKEVPLETTVAVGLYCLCLTGFSLLFFR